MTCAFAGAHTSFLPMIEFGGFQFGAAAMALTGAAIGWGLRPLFLRYRRAFVVAAAALAAVGAAAYDVLDEGPAADAPVVASTSVVTNTARQAITPAQRDSAPYADAHPWTDYLEAAGNAAFDERDYDVALRYWREAAAQVAPQSARGRELAATIARTQRIVDAQL